MDGFYHELKIIYVILSFRLSSAMCAKRQLPAQVTSPDKFFMTDAGIMTVATFEKGMELGRDLTFLEFMDDPLKIRFFEEYYVYMATIALRKSIHAIYLGFEVADTRSDIFGQITQDFFSRLKFSRLKIKELWIDFIANIKEGLWISS